MDSKHILFFGCRVVAATFALLLLYLRIDWILPKTCSFFSEKTASEKVAFLTLPPSPFSSFHCIGTGSQAFDWGVWLTTDRTMCKLYDVCIIGGELVYFEDSNVEGSAPNIYRISAATKSVRHGLFNAREPTLRVVSDSRPNELPFAPSGRLYAHDVMSDGSNYGHVLIDTIIPAFAAAAAFGGDPSSLQLIEWISCDSFLNRDEMRHKSGDEIVEKCRQTLERWIPALFGHPVRSPPHEDMCYHEMLFGHSGVMALDRWFPHRGAAIREMRLALYHNLKLPIPEGPLAAHHIYVWDKRVEFTPSLLNVCATVQGWNLPHKVTCLVPAELSLAEQVTTFTDASLIITEEGSTTYGAFFLRPGTSLVVFGAKEAHMMLSMPDVNVFFMSLVRLKQGEGEALIELALDRALRRIPVIII